MLITRRDILLSSGSILVGAGATALVDFYLTSKQEARVAELQRLQAELETLGAQSKQLARATAAVEVVPNQMREQLRELLEVDSFWRALLDCSHSALGGVAAPFVHFRFWAGFVADIPPPKALGFPPLNFYK